MRKAAFVLGTMTLGLAGCSTSFRPVESVAAEVKRDEVAAAVSMRDVQVGLEGRVKSKGLKTEPVARAKATMFGTVEVALDEKNLGYVELEGVTTRSGRARCLFESHALDKLATVREGQTIHLVCQFAKVQGEAPDRYAVFRNCWVQE